MDNLKLLRLALAVLAVTSACWTAVAQEPLEDDKGLAVCYFSSWAVYRPDAGKFDVDDIDPFLCTHAIFGFAGLSNQTWEIEVLDPWNELCPSDCDPGLCNNCAYQRFVEMKNTNPALKTILAVGGWNEGSEDFSNMVADPGKRKTFIDSSIALIQKEGFDGLDIDWEYPTQRGGKPEDKENFITLLDEMKARFTPLNLLMTAALASGRPTIDPSYDIEGVVRNIDIMSIMTYDYHGAWENITNHNAPLCGYPFDEGDFVTFNVVYSINYWISLGAPKEKLVMGMAVYGRCFTLDDYNQHTMQSYAPTPGTGGPYTRLNGSLGWNEICVRLQDTSDCTSAMESYMYEPYFYCKSDNIWCGYDDTDSISTKARFAKNVGIAGLMFWTIDTDDFHNTCGEGKNPLITTARDAYSKPADPDYLDTLCSKVNPSSTTPDHSTRFTTRFTTNEPISTTIKTYPEKPDCSANPDQEFYPDTDCNKYWQCTGGEATLMMCPMGTVFDPEQDSCVAHDSHDPDPSYCRVWDCQSEGILYPGVDCNEFYECVNGQPVQMFCPTGEYFNPDINNCDFESNVNTNTCNES